MCTTFARCTGLAIARAFAVRPTHARHAKHTAVTIRLQTLDVQQQQQRLASRNAIVSSCTCSVPQERMLLTLLAQ